MVCTHQFVTSTWKSNLNCISDMTSCTRAVQQRLPAVLCNAPRNDMVAALEDTMLNFWANHVAGVQPSLQAAEACKAHHPQCPAFAHIPCLPQMLGCWSSSPCPCECMYTMQYGAVVQSQIDTRIKDLPSSAPTCIIDGCNHHNCHIYSDVQSKGISSAFAAVLVLLDPGGNGPGVSEYKLQANAQGLCQIFPLKQWHLCSFH